MATQLDENTQYIDESTGELLNNGYIYIGLDGLDAKLNPKPIFSDRALSVTLSNPQRIGADGRALNKIWIDGKYSLKVEDSGRNQKLNDLSLGDTTQYNNTNLINVQGTDSLIASGSTAVSALVNNQVYVLTAANTNTGAMTLAIDLLTAYPIKKHHDQDMQAGDIEANQVVALIWNEADSTFELMTNSAIGPVNTANPQTITGVKTFSDGIISDVTGDLTGPTSVGGILKESKGIDVASATALTLGTDGNSFDVTGTTTITSINTVGIGTHVTLQFDGILTLTHHATDLILPGAANITTAAGDIAVFYEYATGDWRCVSYTRSSYPPSGFRGALVSKATQNVLTATTTYLEADTESYDTDSIHDNVTNNSRLTVPSGVTKVRLTANITWSNDAVSYRFAVIVKNRALSTYDPSITTPVNVAATSTSQNLTSPVLIVTGGDYFEVRVVQLSGSTLTTAHWFSMEIIE